MVALRSKMETAASDRVLVVEVGPFVSEQQIDYPRLPIPTGYFEWHPFLTTKDVWVHEFLENKVIHSWGVSNGASDVQWWKLVVTQHAEINLNILRLDNRCDIAPFRATINLITFLIKRTTLCVQNPGLFNLILHDKSDELLFVAVFSNHVTDFVNDEHIVYLFGILNNLFFISLFSLRVFLRSSKCGHMITVFQLHGAASDHGTRRVLGPPGVTELRISQIGRIRLRDNYRVSSRSIPTLNPLHLLLLLMLIRE